MYTYEYERVHVQHGKVLWEGKLFKAGDYRTVIDERARDGWRYAGYIPAEQLGAGFIAELDLIFEKEM